jgi:outer membrane protein TolC
MNKILILRAAIFLLFFPFILSAQALDWPEFRRQVLEQHPLARQADFYPEMANSALLRAKGGFDPKAYSDFYTKNFKEKTYFRYTEAGVKLPTRAGLELKAAYNLASGDFLNQESTLPSNGQASLGVNWSVGQGLLTDERRTALRQARIGLQAAAAERDAALNDLLLDAAKAYWTWVIADNQLSIYNAALQQARMRHTALCESFRQGDKPAVDTIESFIQVQNRQLDINFASVDLQNASLEIRNFLWEKDGSPAPALPAAIALGNVPVSSPGADRETLLNRINVHPALRVYQAKRQSLGEEKRLKSEKKKPVLDLNYNILGSGWDFFPTASADGPDIFAQDIKWGVSFSYPILNRKARGDWQITQVKIAQTELELTQKRQVLQNKVSQYFNDLENLRSQITLFQNITDNYRRLLDAETEKFSQGESSVFLINVREQRWLEARIKYLKLLGEFQKTAAGLRWAVGSE